MGNVTCPSNDDCTVICGDNDVCSRTDIYCPNNYGCNIYCNATKSCQRAEFIWPTVFPFNETYSIICDAQYSCNYVQIIAKTWLSFASDCIITDSRLLIVSLLTFQY